MCARGGGDGGAAQARADEEARQARIRAGSDAVDARFRGFDDGFFDRRRTAYLNFAKPQLNQQFEDATRELSFSLARQGLGSSSVAAQRLARLQADRDLRAQEIAGAAESQVNQARTAVADARRGSLDLVSATGDMDAGINEANARAASLSTMPTYSALGDLFANATEGLAAYQGGVTQNQIFGSNPRAALSRRGSARVVT